eukprot:jgi/Botrbrau1/1358/Bobra.0063s0069.2
MARKVALAPAGRGSGAGPKGVTHGPTRHLPKAEKQPEEAAGPASEKYPRMGGPGWEQIAGKLPPPNVIPGEYASVAVLKGWLNVENSEDFQIRLCPSIFRTGERCRDGDKCLHAHSYLELRVEDAIERGLLEDNYKTVLCKHESELNCPQGVHCPNAHSEDEWRLSAAIKQRARSFLLRSNFRVQQVYEMQDTYKTEYCDYVLQGKDCKHGIMCVKAHNEAELRVYAACHVKSIPLEADVFSYKTQMCNQWVDGVPCPAGFQCRLAHGFEDLRIPDAVLIERIRPSNPQGYKKVKCSKNDCMKHGQCWFYHNERDQLNPWALSKSVLCPKQKELGQCHIKDCPFAHGTEDLTVGHYVTGILRKRGLYATKQSATSGSAAAQGGNVAASTSPGEDYILMSESSLRRQRRKEQAAQKRASGGTDVQKGAWAGRGDQTADLYVDEGASSDVSFVPDLWRNWEGFAQEHLANATIEIIQEKYVETCTYEVMQVFPDMDFLCAKQYALDGRGNAEMAVQLCLENEGAAISTNLTALDVPVDDALRPFGPLGRKHNMSPAHMVGLIEAYKENLDLLKKTLEEQRVSHEEVPEDSLYLPEDYRQLDGTGHMMHGQMHEMLQDLDIDGQTYANTKNLEVTKDLEVERFYQNCNFVPPTPFPGAPATDSALEAGPAHHQERSEPEEDANKGYGPLPEDYSMPPAFFNAPPPSAPASSSLLDQAPASIQGTASTPWVTQPSFPPSYPMPSAKTWEAAPAGDPPVSSLQGSTAGHLREPFWTPPPPEVPTQRPAPPGRSDASLHWKALEALGAGREQAPGYPEAPVGAAPPAQQLAPQFLPTPGGLPTPSELVAGPTTFLHGQQQGLQPTAFLQGQQQGLQATAFLQGQQQGLQPTAFLLDQQQSQQPTAFLLDQQQGQQPTAFLLDHQQGLQPMAFLQGQQQGLQPTALLLDQQQGAFWPGQGVGQLTSAMSNVHIGPPFASAYQPVLFGGMHDSKDAPQLQTEKNAQAWGMSHPGQELAPSRQGGTLLADRPALTPYSHTFGFDFGTVRPQTYVLPQTGMQSAGVQGSPTGRAPAPAFVVRGAKAQFSFQPKIVNQTVQERQTNFSGVMGTGHVTSQDVRVNVDEQTHVLQGPGGGVPTGFPDFPPEAQAPADDEEPSSFDILCDLLLPKDI